MSVNFKISPKRNSGSFIFFLAASFDKDFLLIINNVVPINYFALPPKDSSCMANCGLLAVKCQGVCITLNGGNPGYLPDLTFIRI